MNITTNKVLDQLILVDKDYFQQHATLLPEALQQLINSGFQEIEDGCILLKEFGIDAPGKLTNDYDKCSYEDLFNKFHVEDYITDPVPEIEYLVAGLEAGRQLYNKLTDEFPFKFRITISYCETTYDGDEIEFYGGCVIKCHKIRESCDEKFRTDDLDVFETDAVAVFE